MECPGKVGSLGKRLDVSIGQGPQGGEGKSGGKSRKEMNERGNGAIFYGAKIGICGLIRVFDIERVLES